RSENAELGAGRIVLGQRGDLLEQLRAAVVVEILGPQPLRPGAQPGDHVARELGIKIRSFGPRARGSGEHTHDKALRWPSGGEFGEAHAGELPARGRIEEVAVAHARVPAR